MKKRFTHYFYGKDLKKFNGHFANLLFTLRFITIVLVSLATLALHKNTLANPNNSKPKDSPTIATSANKTGATMPDESNSINKKVNTTLSRGLVNESLYIPKPNWVKLPLYTDPYNGAAQYLPYVQNTPEQKYIEKLAKTPVAQWFGDWNTDVSSDVNSYTGDANRAGSIPVVVAYNIPNRDCGGYSVGGAVNTTEYINWTQDLANGIGDNKTVVVLEPDALGALDCLPKDQQLNRLKSLSEAVKILSVKPNIYVYIDAGTPVWQPLNVMSKRLLEANISEADGFSLNVSYFASTKQNQSFGDKLSKLVGNKHYVIDTSRNGGEQKVTGMQCNPDFAAFGDAPTTTVNNPLNDALLWIKIPWESDGECGGDPGPGQNFWTYVAKMAKNSNW